MYQKTDSFNNILKLKCYFSCAEFRILSLPWCIREPCEQRTTRPCQIRPITTSRITGSSSKIMEGKNSKDFPQEKLNLYSTGGKISLSNYLSNCIKCLLLEVKILYYTTTNIMSCIMLFFKVYIQFHISYIFLTLWEGN